MEQEKLKSLFKKLIDETENDHICSADEMIKFIIRELEKTAILVESR